MIKYEIIDNTTMAWFEDKYGYINWVSPIFADLRKKFSIEVSSLDCFDKIYDYIHSMPWVATVTCKGGDKFCPIVGKEMAKKKLLKRYYICLFKCRDMVIAYYEQKTDEAIKKAQLGKLACKIYDLEEELRGKK